MIWRGHLDLPAELADKVPRFVTEAIVAFAGIGLGVGLRLSLQQILPDMAPFALTFPIIAAVALVAGARAGLMTLIGCQLLIWYAILPPQRSFAFESATVAFNLILITLAQLVMLWAVASYRNVVRAAQDEDRQKIDDLSLALREIDHRTKNNFQLAVGFLEIQARNSEDQPLRSALQRAASRLQAISGVYKNLALSSTDLNAVRLHDYLADMCERLREGLLSPAIMLTLEADQVTVSHEAAVRIGLIVNELVTNAAKHAFPDGIGSIMLRLERRESEIFLSISDDGKGFDREAANDGLGSKLIAMLIRQIKATHATESDRGTIHRLTIPLPNK